MAFLGSVRLTIVLLAALLVMSVWGTLAPHRNVYHTPGYYAVLVMLAVNLILCSTQRLIKRRRFGQREWGYLLTHLGILLLLAGALISLITGFRALIFLSPGETVNRLVYSPDDSGIAEQTPVDLGFSMTLKQFVLDLRDNGMPGEFTSEIHLELPGENTRDAAITVNHPLKINGYRVYQASYRLSRRQTVTLSIQRPGEMVPRSFPVVVGGDPLKISTAACDPLVISGLQYEPDFVMSGPGRFGSRSILPRNPAVRLSLRCGSSETETQWLFLRHRDVHHMPPAEGMDVQFVSVDQQYDTGLEIVKDPGTFWVTAGALLLTAGLMAYLFPIPSRKRTVR